MGLTLDEQQNKNDVMFESHGVKIVYDKELEPYFNGLTLDYNNEMPNVGFIFTQGSS